MSARFATLGALENELHEMGTHTPEYWDKQIHPVPKSKTVDRNAFLIERCTGKTVLHIGCTGPLDEALRKVAKKCYGIDKEPQERPDFTRIDLDCLGWVELGQHIGFQRLDDVEMIVCGEVLEHLSNPGRFLDELHAAYSAPIPVLFTVPNAFTLGGQEWLVKRGRENVNKDHVCYYSYTTLKELLRRAGYAITEHYWYGGRPYVSEGLIVIARPA